MFCGCCWYQPIPLTIRLLVRRRYIANNRHRGKCTLWPQCQGHCAHMFETLEEMSERSKRPLRRRWAILEYSAFALVGVVYVMEGIQRNHPVEAVVGAVVSLLSLTWLITTARLPGPVRRRDFWQRGQILIWILLAYQIAYTVASRLL
jgi:hypothetical protein